MVAQDDKCHTICLVKYNRERKAMAERLQSTNEQEQMSRNAFAELVVYY